MKIYKRQLIFFTIWLYLGLVLYKIGINTYDEEVYHSTIGLLGGYMLNMILYLILEHREKKKQLEYIKKLSKQGFVLKQDAIVVEDDLNSVIDVKEEHLNNGWVDKENK